MSCIEIIAAETTGVRESDEVIEIAIGRYVLGAGLAGLQHVILPPSEKLDWDPGAVAHHTKTGLLEALMHGDQGTDEKASLGPANMRLIWVRDFILPYLKPHLGDAVATSTDAAGVMLLAETLHDLRFEKQWRALPKVRIVAQALDALAGQ